MKRNGMKKESIAEKLGGKRNCIAMAIFAAVALGVGIWMIEMDARRAEENRYIDSWPITINRVELGYAGKGGF